MTWPWGNQPPVGSLGAPLPGAGNAFPPVGAFGAPIAPQQAQPGVDPGLIAQVMGMRRGGRIPRFSDVQGSDINDRPVDTTWGGSSMGLAAMGGPRFYDESTWHHDPGGIGFGPVNPHGLESASWRDVGQGVMGILTGGLGGMVGVAASNAADRIRDDFMGPPTRNAGRARQGLGALGGATGLPLGTAADIFMILRNRGIGGRP